jgi:NitT/TauT family transport system substrate-binding protein
MLLAGLTGVAEAQTDTLRFGQIPSTVRGTSSVYLRIAEQQGYLARERIKLQLIPIAGGTDKMVAALDRGEVDVTQTATPYLIQAVLAGSDAVGIASETANPIYSLIVKPGIGSFAELKDKLIGLSLPVDTISISMRKLLALKGLNAADYRVKELVGTPVRFDCLKRGECDAVPLGQPDDLIAISQGYRRLGDSTEAVSAFQFQLLAVKRSWAQANHDVALRFVRAIASAFQFIRDPSRRDEVIKAMVEVTGSSEDIARRTLALYFQPDKGVIPPRGQINLPGLAQVITFMGEGGLLRTPLPPPERFVDLRYLREAGGN